MSENAVLTDLAEGVLTVRLNRVDKKNALTQAMYTALSDALDQASADPAVKVVLLTGSPECFCAGNDLMDFMNLKPSPGISPVERFMRTLAGFEKPVVTAVSGVAVGIGVTLLLHSDLIYCGAETKLSMPFVSLGICPEFASSYVLPRIMGHARACELLLLGEPFNAATALEYGLVNAVLPNVEVEAHARAKALKLAAQPPRAMRISKRLLKKWSQATAIEAIEHEAKFFVPMLKQAEAIESITAFMQKRKPDYSKIDYSQFADG
jgi:enoyl-CoA hydratase/carnithine racemase